MTFPIAIINCSIRTDDGDLPSAVILIEQGKIAAAGPEQTILLPPNAQLIDAGRGSVSLGDLSSDGRSIRAGLSADLVCRTRFGEIAWVMAAGEIIYPPDATPPPLPITWETRRTSAIKRVTAFLLARPESVDLRLASDHPDLGKRGIDLLWRFRQKDDAVESLSIRVVPALSDEHGRIFVLDGKSARKLPTAGLSKTSAQWWFYLHNVDHTLYCFPVPSLRRWMRVHARKIPLTQLRVAGVPGLLSGREILASHLQEDIPRTRIIPL